MQKVILGLAFLFLLMYSDVLKAQSANEYDSLVLKKIEAGKLLDADMLTDHWLKSFPNDEQAHLAKSHLIDQRIGRREALVYLFEQAEKYPTSFKIYASTGSLCMNSSLFDTAFYFLNKAKELTQKRSEQMQCAYDIAMLHYYKEDYQQSIQLFVEFIKDSVDCLSCYAKLSIVYWRLKQYDHAIDCTQKAMRVDTANSVLYNNMGLYLSEQGKYQEAIEYISKGITLDPKEAYAYSNRGNCYRLLKQYPEAIRDINKSISLDSKNSYAYRNRALVYLDQHLKKEACIELMHAKEMGFQKFYGSEVEELIATNCEKE